jgi:hypothetical protein
VRAGGGGAEGIGAAGRGLLRGRGGTAPRRPHRAAPRCAPRARQVVETITELAQVMRDLSTLVVEQGTMLDRIDHNITQTAIKVGGRPQGVGVGSGGTRGEVAPVAAGGARALLPTGAFTPPPNAPPRPRPPPPPRQVEEGTKELVKAEQTQKSGRAAMCITLLLVLVALFLILTIVRHA